MRVLSLIVVIAGLAVAGCAGGKIHSVKTDVGQGQIPAGAVIQVKDFDASKATFAGDYSDVPQRVADERAGIPGMISGELIAALKARGFKAEKFTAEAAGAIVIDGAVTSVDHGSSAARFWLAWGAGASHIIASVTITKAGEAAKPLGEIEVAGTSGGAGGFSAWSDWVKANAKDLAKALAEYVGDKAAK